MSKEVKFYITDFRRFHEIVNTPIRYKEDIIKILLFSIKNLLINSDCENEDKGEVIISIDKSSRIYFICKNKDELPSKYYSFTFPFSLQNVDEGKYIVSCKTSLQVIDSELIDKLIVLLDKGWFSENNTSSDDIDNFACSFMDDMEDYYYARGVECEDMKSLYTAHWSIVKTLLTFEPSYIRYDFDPKYENGQIHPLNHLDVNYSSNGTYKLGFDDTFNKRKRIEFVKFKDILENGKLRDDKCYTIK